MGHESTATCSQSVPNMKSIKRDLLIVAQQHMVPESQFLYYIFLWEVRILPPSPGLPIYYHPFEVNWIIRSIQICNAAHPHFLQKNKHHKSVIGSCSHQDLNSGWANQATMFSSMIINNILYCGYKILKIMLAPNCKTELLDQNTSQ